jgi:replicative DNA helicase
MSKISEFNLERTPKCNIDAEQLLLGSILTNNEAYNQVADFLKPQHFYEVIHQKIYESFSKILDKGMHASVVSVDSMMVQDASYLDCGGKQYLAGLVARSISVISYLDHAKIIYDLYLKRILISIGEEIVNDTYDSTLSNPSTDLMEKAESKLFSLATEGVSEKGFDKISTSIKDSLATISRVMKTPSNTTGVTSGFRDLDHKLFGFHSSDLIILAGRPSMGKTALALNFAINACRSLSASSRNKEDIKSVGFFSLEMSAEQLSTRLLAMNSNVDASSLRSGKINESEYNRLRSTADELSAMPFFIDDSGSLTVSAIRTRARRLKRRNNLGILFIDYLQLITGSNRDNRVLEISEITMGLKSLAKELSIPIVVLSQLSRAVESRDDKRPMLSDLRESGAIEQDADVVMFIYRDEYYLSRKEPSAGTDKHQEWLEKLNKVHNQAEVIVAKHRNGPIGNVLLFYDSNHSKFGDFESRYNNN